MKRTLTFVVVAVVVVVGGLAVAGSRGLRMFGIGKGKRETYVKLTMQGGMCSVNPQVDDLGGAWKNKIKWNITNVDCDIPQYVAFFEYRERTDSTLGDIEKIVDPYPANSKQIARGGSDPVEGRIEKFHLNLFNDKRYKYKICVGPSPNPSTNCLDPDVDVWPF